MTTKLVLLFVLIVLSFLLQSSVLDLKEKASSLASSTLKKENRLKSMEISLEQKKEECVKLENQLKKVGQHSVSQNLRKNVKRLNC